MSTLNQQPEPWLRGPVAGVPPSLQPVACALIASREDVDRAIEGISPEELWARPAGVASIGFHLAHLAGSTDRLLSYARGEALSEAQRADLARERAADEERADAEQLVAAFHEAIDRGLNQLSDTSESTLGEARAVGRAAGSSVLGILFHVGEHAARHAGQIVTTRKIIRENRA